MTASTSPGAAVMSGARVHRVEDARLLTGRGTFVDDVSLPGMLHACFVRSPFAARRDPGDRHVGGAGACPASASCSPPPT